MRSEKRSRCTQGPRSLTLNLGAVNVDTCRRPPSVTAGPSARGTPRSGSLGREHDDFIWMEADGEQMGWQGRDHSALVPVTE